MTCCFKHAFLILVITFFETKSDESVAILDGQNPKLSVKRFDYIPNRIESAKKLNTGTKIRDRSSRTGKLSPFFFYFGICQLDVTVYGLPLYRLFFLNNSQTLLFAVAIKGRNANP